MKLKTGGVFQPAEEWFECCRSAEFSSKRFRRVRKMGTIEARASPIACSLEGCYRESRVNGNRLYS